MLARLVSLHEIRSGQVDIVDIIKLNALLDAREAAQERAAKIKTGKP